CFWTTTAAYNWDHLTLPSAQPRTQESALKERSSLRQPALRSWKAAWKWANSCSPAILQNTKEEYPPAAAA
ncbi:hypothetical protein M514_27979, partial [Trichuris suis]